MSSVSRENYRVRTAGTSTLVGWVVASVVFGLATAGCTGFADQARQEQQQPAESVQQTATGLYEAMVEVFEEDTEGVERTSEQTLTVISEYESVPEERRRRFVGRVVPLDGGIGVQITAEYQNDVAADGQQPQWEDQPREVVEREASPDELSLARRVERTYHAMEW